MGKTVWQKMPVPVSVRNQETVYKQLKINNVSTNYLYNFVTSRKKFYKELRKLYRRAYRQAYQLLQEKGLDLTMQASK